MAKRSTVIRNTNYATITPNQFVDTMVQLYSSAIGVNQPSKMLWGQPGIGKSQAVQQFAEALQRKTGKTVNVKIVSLLLMSPIDLRGIPAKSEDKKGNEIAKWLPPDIFNMDSSENVINVLFLDEISAAPLSVQAAAYQICLDKRIGEHKLPDNTMVICAGNRVTDKAVAFKMPKPLSNRLTHFEMVADYNSWKSWAVKNNIDPRIIEYIRHTNGEALNQFDTDNDDVAFATPRSWEMVDVYLKTIDDKLSVDEKERMFNNLFPCIEGCVGSGTAIQFKKYIEIYTGLPDIDAIKRGAIKQLDKKLMKKPDIMYFLSSTLVSVLVKAGIDVDWSNDVSKKQFNDILDNVLGYILNWPDEMSEFKVYIAKDISMAWKDTAQDTKHAIFANATYNKLLGILCSDLGM